MAQDYLKYLAANVLSDGNIVTYRSLSRALKVHSNVAKRMLYDFHRRETTQKPGSVHATYLVSGTQVVTEPPVENGIKDEEKDGDVHMQSSPYMSSPMPAQEEEEDEAQRQKIITLVREEHLEALKDKYEEISSVHVYSLEPSSIQNLEILSNVTQQIISNYAHEDPLVHNKVYGAVLNVNVKRRTGAKLPIPVLPQEVQAKAATKAPTKPLAEPVKPASEKPEVKQGRAPEQKKVTSKPSGIKRERSDLFKSFAKSRPKLERKNTDSSVTSAAPSLSEKPPTQEDVVMDDASDDEQEEVVFDSKKDSAAQSNARAERKEELRKMMEDDKDEPTGSTPDSGNEEEAEEEEGADDSMPIDAPKEELEEKPTVTVSGGRRRGRRKVNKKKTMKDAEGYLVTKEEAVWESFSEDEPAPAPASVPKPKTVAPAAKGGKKTAGGKPGQGSIMSFFGKK